MPDSVVTRFSASLRRLKKKSGLSTYALAKRANLNSSGLRGLERGLHAPTWRSAVSLAKALNVSVQEFV
jgi:transcriptional regulator with XRE-family HTH domain